MINTELYNESNEATYCPEDDKLRLYVGRVPREEYLALKKEGWTSTPKQNCDFAAVWTVSRENTALSYAGFIGDEDQDPQDRAADRAERFSEYREKRRSEAHTQADLFSGGAIGYQNQDRADRAVRKQNRIADKACNLWAKAEYWQQRTSGVISNALYKSTPSVRMGRIKKLESEQRKAEKDLKIYNATREMWIKISKETDPEKQNKLAVYVSGRSSDWTEYTHPKNPEIKWYGLYSLLTSENIEPITGAEAAKMYLETHPEGIKGRYTKHIELRLQYERQMLEAAGGRAGELEMEIGGFIGSFQIHKIHKSPATKRIVSVTVLAPKTGYIYQDIEGTEHSYQKLTVERCSKSVYTPPQPGDLEKVKDFQKSIKKDKKPTLINPTIEDAQRLQDIWNQAKPDREPSEIVQYTQKEYSHRNQGSYSPAGTVFIGEDGRKTYKQYYGNTEEGAICKIRYMTSAGLYTPDHVVVITDKPQKALPTFVEKVTA